MFINIFKRLGSATTFELGGALPLLDSYGSGQTDFITGGPVNHGFDIQCYYTSLSDCNGIHWFEIE